MNNADYALLEASFVFLLKRRSMLNRYREMIESGRSGRARWYVFWRLDREYRRRLRLTYTHDVLDEALVRCQEAT